MAAISISLPLLSLLVIVPLFLAEAEGFGFTADLIHRDSPQSPFYNPSSTKTERFNDAIKRSFSRAARFKQSLSESPNDIQSQIVPASGEYLMKLSIGTPPFEILGIADTGSDLMWTQCEPCTQCYNQNAPLFDPQNSSTYSELSCQSQPCQALPTSSCDEEACQYRMTYGDQSYSVGTLAAETFTMGSASGQAVSIPNMVFGCGHNDEGTFNETAMGIIGLGGGSVSLISQLSDSINGKFSYCLSGFNTDDTIKSKINFGDSAVISGSGVVSTPIGSKEISTFYYLTLESITVGNKSLAYETKMKSSGDDDGQQGNIIIDSGTTLTLLPGDLYEKLESEVKQAIKSEPSANPQGALGLCYGHISIDDLPNMTFKFTGAELELSPTNTFVQNGELICLAIIPSDMGIAIFGNLGQMNFLIGYDLVKKQVSFMPTDCSKN
ncbi:Aspartic proteinase [Actinidia chinensis var. chinensis]|uniref:Aspartic proteinase n=1 Tax=Actinidia chinensis var. chinensis TaxID=1590841 RepID=A0A2R6P2X0_ACTCC|nr:Aspartic proteinase [Actinidia chinensis var. chinensis]